ncbi:DUF4331 family protein [Tsuneonella deserti]|nr:DUF4331 family protein [Tsuneonella deserti]
MRTLIGWLVGAGVLAMLAALGLLVSGAANHAADHLDPPGRTDPAIDSTPDVPADIADVFAWYGPDTVKLALTFAGPSVGSQPAVYDRDVLYKVLVSTAPPDDTPEIVIRTRFGAGTRPNEYGVRFEGVPGVTGSIEGPVETTLEKDGVKARAGLFDDPFYFDLRGFRETRSTGSIRFNNQRDFFAGQNDTGFILEIPRSRFAGGNGTINVWATTARFGGQK